MADGIDAEEIIRAFLLGVARGAAEQLPTPEQAGKSIGGRVTRGRSKATARTSPVKAARKVSAYQKAYGKNFKKLAPKNKKANGSWKKDGFKRTQKAAHAATRKEMKK